MSFSLCLCPWLSLLLCLYLLHIYVLRLGCTLASFILSFLFTDWLFMHNLQVHLIFLFHPFHTGSLEISVSLLLVFKERDWFCSLHLKSTLSPGSIKKYFHGKNLYSEKKPVWILAQMSNSCVFLNMSSISLGCSLEIRHGERRTIKRKSLSQAGQDVGPGRDRQDGWFSVWATCFELLWSFIFRILGLVTFRDCTRHRRK